MTTTTTATLERPAAPAAPAARAAAPRAIVVGGTFDDAGRLSETIAALRRAGRSEDVVGLAVPLPGDPETPEVVARIVQQRRRPRFDPIGFLITVIDPHRPPPDAATLQRGQNSILATLVLGKIAGWLVGVKPFRIPIEQAPEGGVWVLGRPNHAAALAGMEGAATGGTRGALAAIGIPDELAEAFASHLLAGNAVLTTCETDQGRAQRDQQLLRRHGAANLFEFPIFLEQGSAGSRPPA